MNPSLVAFQEALQQSPDNIPLLLLYGRACLEELAFDQAVEAFEEAVRLEPDDIDAQIGLARALILNGDASQAAIRAERVLQQEPDQAAAHLILSRIHLAEGDRVRAKQHFEEAARIDPSVADTGLERDMGRSLLETRRRLFSNGKVSGPQLAGDNSNPSSDNNSEAEEDEFLDEFDWRPENFWQVGDSERPQVCFDDVAGLEEIKEEIRQRMVYPLQEPDLYRSFQQRTGGGILLYGPPGCGKTLLMRAIAGEIPANYMAVGLHEIFDPYFGSTERNLHQIFETARQNQPCVLAIDGLDSLGQDRQQVRESHLRNVVNQLLNELDGLTSQNQRVLIIAATSQPWVLDPALCRAGRFDEVIFVPPPDAPTRRQLFQQLAAERPVAPLDFDLLVRETQGFSGADIVGVMDRAARHSLRRAMREQSVFPISMNEVLEAVRACEPATLSWLEDARTLPTAVDSHHNWLARDMRSFQQEPSQAGKR